MNDPIQEAALDAVKAIIEANWNDAKNCADENGNFSMSVRISVKDGKPAKVKVTSRFSQSTSDEIVATIA
jgi:hypothetical protein